MSVQQLRRRHSGLAILAICGALLLACRSAEPTQPPPPPPPPAEAPPGIPLHPVVSAGPTHTCALGIGGALYCWGTAPAGELGISSTQASLPTPYRAATDKIFGAITAGAQFTCGLSAGDGAAWCWGNNSNGELGVGEAGNNFPDPWTPHAVIGGRVFLSLQTSGFATCGLTLAHAGVCWGGNWFGQLGRGDTSQVGPTPQPAADSLPMSGIQVGNNSGCGFARATGALWCWGPISGSWSGATLPVTPTDLQASGLRGLAAGGAHYCAIATRDSIPSCWGRNVEGQLGRGTTSYDNETVSPILGRLAVTAIAAGDAHTCALTASGVAWCWGMNASGQLGDSTFTERDQPVPVFGGLRFRSISAGWRHTCGVTLDDRLYCWGSNEYGQVGDGSGTNQPAPVQIVLPTNSP